LFALGSPVVAVKAPSEIYSGSLSGFSAQKRAGIASFNMISSQDGMNGRSVKVISRDDG
jgi:hypothetical protein